MKNYKNIIEYNFLKNLFFLIVLISFSILIFILISFRFDFVQSQTTEVSIPMCSSPNNLVIIPGRWQSYRFLVTASSSGSLSYIPWYFSTTSNRENIVTASDTWMVFNKGLILSGPSNNFTSAGSLYFRDLTKSTGSGTSSRYNEFSIFMPTSSNNLVFYYNDVVRNTSNTVLTISTSGQLIIPNNLFSNNIISNNIIVNRNISALNALSIGTTALGDKIYIFSTSSDQYINIESGSTGGNLKLGSLFNPPEAVIRFKEILKIFYSNSASPILTINNNRKIGVNTSIPEVALDIKGDLRASGDIMTNNRFCLGSNCIDRWPTGGGISGGGTTDFLPLWTSNSYLGNSILKQISTNNAPYIENKGRGIISREFCIMTGNNNLSCLSNWPNRPAVAHFYSFTVGPKYWAPFLSNLIDTTTEDEVSNIDPYIRPTDTSKYNRNIGNGYPYLNLRDIITRIGVNPNNPLATKWFILGYSYRQVYKNVLTSLFIKEGDNLYPVTRITKTSNLDGDWDEVFVYCRYRQETGSNEVIKYDTTDQSLCENIRNGRRSGFTIESYTYAKKTATLRGYVVLDLNFEPARQRNVCTKKDYLNPMSVASWGTPSVIHLRVNNYRYPNLNNDPCVDESRRPNLHSLIMGRFRVNPYPNVSSSDYRYIDPSNIDEFNTTSIDFYVVIEDLGVAELLSY